MQLRTILCPTDFSECSDAALEYAVDLAQRFGASVELLHVFQAPVYVGWEDGFAPLTVAAPYLEEGRKQATKRLNELRDRHASSGVPIMARQIDGVPSQTIVEEGEGADLIAMGTHGRTGLSHLMLGSVAERVVRTAHKPVLTIPSSKPQ